MILNLKGAQRRGRRATGLRRKAILLAAFPLSLLAFSSTWTVAGGAQAPAMGSACPPRPSAGHSFSTPPSPVAQPLLAGSGAPSPGPEQIVACVGPQPLTGAIFTHWWKIASRSTSSETKGKQPEDKEVLSEVMRYLISAYWITGEAQDLGVRVSPAQVRQAYEHIRVLQFPKRGEFKTFLRSSGQTISDLLFRVRVNLLANRLLKHVTAGHRKGSDKQRAVTRFIRGFRTRWKAQTYCAPSYAVADCGHVQESL